MDQQKNRLDIFAERGGQYLITYPELTDKALNTKMIIFDWDGVFNGGYKGEATYSPFSEIDSMGLNILRFGYHIQTGHILTAGIISGMDNKNTETFVRREHLDFQCLGFKDKNEGLKKIQKDFGIQPGETAFIFDDILDLTVAEQCGLRFQVRHDASPIFDQYVKKHHLADYITAQTGENHAVREITELLLTATGQYDDAVESRTHFDARYADYITRRNSITPKQYTAGTRY